MRERKADYFWLKRRSLTKFNKRGETSWGALPETKANSTAEILFIGKERI
jgi:hypothetical protein